MLYKDNLEVYGVSSVIVHLKDSVSKSELDAICGCFKVSKYSLQSAIINDMEKPCRNHAFRHYKNLGLIFGTVNKETINSLEKERGVSSILSTPAVSRIETVRSKRTRLTGNTTWGIAAMKVPGLWKMGWDGTDVRIAHLDTGISVTHPALKDAVSGFAVFDAIGNKVNPTPKPFDNHGHGSHTAGIIAGRPVGNRHIGVSPNAKLFSAVVVDGGNIIARMLSGLDWALSQDVKIINLSIGVQGFRNDFIELIRIIRSKNILPVIAVGNEGPGASRSPGNYAEALSVGSMGRNKMVLNSSSSEDFPRIADPIVPDLVAPGANVVSATPSGGYRSNNGTSMAAPHISGLAALLWQAKPNATVDEIEGAILASCTVLTKSKAQRQGRGLPNAELALKLLQQ